MRKGGMMPNIPLWMQLIHQPSAPNRGFDKFVVGQLQGVANQFKNLIDDMVNGNMPSNVRLVLGANGDGKTLLNNILMYYATELNLTRQDDVVTESNFKVLFSRISLSQADPANYPIELAKSLQRSIFEASNVTYSAIANRVLRDFTESYKPPLHVKLYSLVPRILLKYAVRKYEDVLNELITREGVDILQGSLNKAFDKVQRRLTSKRLQRAFRKYSEDCGVNIFMEPFFRGSRIEELSVHQLNRGLYASLLNNQATNNPLDTIDAISTIAKNVGCRLILLMVDDCNRPGSSQCLLPIADQLSRYTEPKLLLIISAIRTAWDHYSISNPYDKSIADKLDKYAERIILNSPNTHDLGQLYDRLFVLMNDEMREEGEWIQEDKANRTQLINNCHNCTYRDAIVKIIGELRGRAINI